MRATPMLNKVVRLGTTSNGSRRPMDVFCKITLEQGRLSISGVEGPLPSGDSSGSCGQIVMNRPEIAKPAPHWTQERIARFWDVWDKWHLNDMRPNCAHQVGPEWTAKDVTLYHFTLKPEISKKQDETKALALAAIKRGEVFTPTLEQSRLAILDYSMVHYEPALPAAFAEFYAPKVPLYPGDKGPTETKSTGWLRPGEHPEGFLCKPCPVCGYKYGSEWLAEELPDDVITFLEELPNADKAPAWV